jgi:hypothetical protein
VKGPQWYQEPGIQTAQQKHIQVPWCKNPHVAGREGQPDGQPLLKPSLVKDSFAHVEPAAGKAAAYFYGQLFASNPAMRALFPPAMDRQREHFSRALSRLIWSLDFPLPAWLATTGHATSSTALAPFAADPLPSCPAR